MSKIFCFVSFLSLSCAASSVKKQNENANEVTEVNYPLFDKEAEVLSVRFASSDEITCATNKKCLILALNQGLDRQDQSKVNAFYGEVKKEFHLVDKNGLKLDAIFYGITDGNRKVRGNQMGFSLMLSEESTKKLKSGQEYQVIYQGELKQKDFSWKFPQNFSVKVP